MSSGTEMTGGELTAMDGQQYGVRCPLGAPHRRNDDVGVYDGTHLVENL
jgi:hypothetical protein